jgi:hypothetical protein
MPFQWLLFLLPFGLATCFYTAPSPQKTRYAQLKISIDSSANFYLDTVSVITKYGNSTAGHQKYDSASGKYAFVFEVEKGKVQIQVTSFLNKTFTKEVDFDKDTIIFISAVELGNFHDEKERTLPSFDLIEGDTIVIALSSLGCFHYYKENIVVSKRNDKYKIAFNNTRLRGYGLGNMNITKEVDSSFVDTLDMFVAQCKELLKAKQFCFSTTSANVYIRKANSVYKLPDIVCGDWQGYNRLVASLNPPWPKIEN